METATRETPQPPAIYEGNEGTVLGTLAFNIQAGEKITFTAVKESITAELVDQIHQRVLHELQSNQTQIQEVIVFDLNELCTFRVSDVALRGDGSVECQVSVLQK